MSKLNQIQRAILEMGGGQFQKLADAYLKERGHDRINSIGSVTGANKVKTGTPDTLVALPNGNYVFAEHTTQQEELLGKIKDDLVKCFNEAKTGIPIEKIERVMFCFTSESGLGADQENELIELCKEKGVHLDLFGIDTIAFDLYLKYPGLARDFLGIEIDTGQIVSPDQFIELYNKDKLATRLDLSFHFREDEVDEVLSALEEGNLVVISGRPGIGKSRLALEACARFQSARSDYEVWCIFKRERDLWEDLKARFSKPGNFLILVDDANRISRFEYVVDLLQHQRNDQQIKVVATVRDYALSTVREAARPLGGGAEVEVISFSDEQIKELVEDEYGIRNHTFLERIADVARGNPRLAVMAGEVITNEGTFESVQDVSNLYDRYFSSIREDLHEGGADIGNTDLLRAAGVAAFFKAVDRTNEEMMTAIEEAFDLSPEVFWELALQLHDMEVLDMHEDEVVRVSDQVLSTYLFYLATFKEGALDFGALLDHFFPRFRQRLIDSLNPVLSAFDHKYIIELLRPHVERAWLRLEAEGNEPGFLQLLDVFWFVKRTDTLLWIRNRIAEMKTEQAEFADLRFEKDANAVSSPSLLSVLGSFAYAEVDEVKISLDLLMQYLAKRPAEVSTVLQLLLEQYGFKYISHRRGFEIQRAVVDALWQRVEEEGLLFPRTFIAVAGNYLNTHFETYRMEETRVLQIQRFDVPATPELAALRATIWERLFVLYDNADLQDDVLNVIHGYSTSHFRVNNSEVVESDAKHLVPLLVSVLDADNYWHCLVLHDYLDLLERHGVEDHDNLREQFRNDTYELSEILLQEFGDGRGPDTSLEEFQQYKRVQIAEFTSDYTFDDYVRFFEQCLEIRQSSDPRRTEYLIKKGVVEALLSLAEENSDLFEQVLKHYLTLGDPLGLNGYSLVQKLLEHRGLDASRRFLSGLEYLTRDRWLFYIHEVLLEEAINEEQLNHLYGLYERAELANLPAGWGYLLKFLPLDKRVVARVVKRVLDKVEEPHHGSAFSLMFNPNTKVPEQIANLFADDVDLLKQAYLILEGAHHHPDYTGSVFNVLLDLDPDFITEYIDWKYKNAKNGWLSPHHDHRDYAFIWSRPDYEEIMERAAEEVFSQKQERAAYARSTYLQAFFPGEEESNVAPEVQERQNTLLSHLIEKRHGDSAFMKFLFTVIAHFSPERRRLFIERFVQYNTSIEDFKKLMLEPSSRSTTGSWVPVLQRQLTYWESLLPIMKSVELLPHKQYIERRIQGLRAEIEREKKSDFMED